MRSPENTPRCLTIGFHRQDINSIIRSFVKYMYYMFLQCVHSSIIYILDIEAVVLRVAESSVHCLDNEICWTFVWKSDQKFDELTSREIYNRNKQDKVNNRHKTKSTTDTTRQSTTDVNGQKSSKLIFKHINLLNLKQLIKFVFEHWPYLNRTDRTI